MRIGLDFDNTIVCYEKAITLLASELFELPQDVPRTKLGLREFFRATNREQEWTEFQGNLYGPGMTYAEPFNGAIASMQALVKNGHDLLIISHRSRAPYAGPPFDLHAAANTWITLHLQSAGLFISNNSAAIFLETREEKVVKISELKCEAFLDDLPEVLLTQGFPEGVLGVLFDPSGTHEIPPRCKRITAWAELSQLVDSLVE